MLGDGNSRQSDLQVHSSSLMGEGWKTLTVGHCLKVFSTIQGKTMARHFAILAQRLYNRYNHAHVPGQHMWPSPGPWQDSKCSSQMFML